MGNNEERNEGARGASVKSENHHGALGCLLFLGSTGTNGEINRTKKKEAKNGTTK